METKQCTKCKQILPIDDFYWKDKKKGYRCSHCKKCHNEICKAGYKKRKDSLIERKAATGCVKCGEKRGYILDFHHIDPSQKEYNIAQLTARQCRSEKLDNELAKCIVLCANCHREFHYFENNIEGFTIQDYLGDSFNGEESRL